MATRKTTASTSKTTTSKTNEETQSVDVNAQLQKQLEEMQKQMALLTKQLESKDVELEKAEKEKEEAKRKSKQLDKNRRVPVRSVREGGLTYVSKSTGLTTTWSAYGDEQFMEVEELIRMKASSPTFLGRPWIVIDDEDVVEYLGLKDTYDKIIPVEEMDGFFKKNVEYIEELIKKAPKGTKELVASRARRLVQKGELDSNKVIKLLEKLLEIDLSMVQD